MRYIYRNGKVIEADLASYEPRPWITGIISDHMEPARHMGSGRVIDSKAKFRAETKATGCIELGNEPIRPRVPIKLDKAQRRDDIRRTVYNLRNGIK